MFSPNANDQVDVGRDGTIRWKPPMTSISDSLSESRLAKLPSLGLLVDSEGQGHESVDNLIDDDSRATQDTLLNVDELLWSVSKLKPHASHAALFPCTPIERFVGLVESLRTDGLREVVEVLPDDGTVISGLHLTNTDT